MLWVFWWILYYVAAMTATAAAFYYVQTKVCKKFNLKARYKGYKTIMLSTLVVLN